MSPVQPNDVEQWVQQIQDALVSSDGVRDGLHDDEAIPLMEWGAASASRVAAHLAAPDTPDPDAEQVGSAAYALTRLLTRVNWVVTFRNKKDAAWLTRTFATINQLSRELYGEAAPTLSDDEITAWIASHAGHTNAELIQTLIARLTPAPDSSTSESPASPSGEVPAPDAFDPLGPHPSGDFNDQAQQPADEH